MSAARQEDFVFAEHVLRRGETLWELATQRYRVPVWLLRQYNPDLDFAGRAMRNIDLTLSVMQTAGSYPCWKAVTTWLVCWSYRPVALIPYPK